MHTPQHQNINGGISKKKNMRTWKWHRIELNLYTYAPCKVNLVITFYATSYHRENITYPNSKWRRFSYNFTLNKGLLSYLTYELTRNKNLLFFIRKTHETFFMICFSLTDWQRTHGWWWLRWPKSAKFIERCCMI